MWRTECYPVVARAAAVRACEVVIPRSIAATNEPTPRTLRSIGQRSRLAAVVANKRWWALIPPVSALTCAGKHRSSAGVLAVAVLRHTIVTNRVPLLGCFAG